MTFSSVLALREVKESGESGFSLIMMYSSQIRIRDFRSEISDIGPILDTLWCVAREF